MIFDKIRQNLKKIFKMLNKLLSYSKWNSMEQTQLSIEFSMMWRIWKKWTEMFLLERKQ